MNGITFITGNQAKAASPAKHLNHPISHRKVDLDEIQSLELNEIAEQKARQAYRIVGSPILVEDVGLVFEPLSKLPGPFIKWFEIELGLDRICKLVDKLGNRKAVASVCFVYYDGQNIKFFDGQLSGSISDKPRGNNGFGFDPIFIPQSTNKTLAEMDEAETEKFSLRTTTVYPQIKQFLGSID